MRLSVRSIGLLLGLGLAAGTLAQDVTVPVEVFTAPKAVKITKPVYPYSQRNVGNEGWVQVNFMISPKGEPYEITVVDSSGIDAFEAAALKEVKNWVFEPAKVGNTPVDAGQNYKLIFAMYEPSTGASEKFVKAYKSLSKAINAGDQAAADAALAKLEAKNLYEDAFRNLASYYYHAKWGTESQQLLDLRRTIAREKRPKYLKKDMFTSALERLLLLEVKDQDFASALETWDKLEPLASKETLQQWAAPIAEIRALRASDRPYKLSGHIAKGTSWNGELFRKRFAITVTSGKIEEIKLRCQQQYIFFKYDPGLTYTVDSRNRSCDIEIVGDHDTRFDLIQS